MAKFLENYNDFLKCTFMFSPKYLLKFVTDLLSPINFLQLSMVLPLLPYLYFALILLYWFPLYWINIFPIALKTIFTILANKNFTFFLSFAHLKINHCLYMSSSSNSIFCNYAGLFLWGIFNQLHTLNTTSYLTSVYVSVTNIFYHLPCVKYYARLYMG